MRKEDLNKKDKFVVYHIDTTAWDESVEQNCAGPTE
jgi:hypothetical protein